MLFSVISRTELFPLNYLPDPLQAHSHLGRGISPFGYPISHPNFGTVAAYLPSYVSTVVLLDREHLSNLAPKYVLATRTYATNRKLKRSFRVCLRGPLANLNAIRHSKDHGSVHFTLVGLGEAIRCKICPPGTLKSC